MIQGKEIRIGNYLKDRGGKVLRVDFIEYVENGFDTKFGQKMFVEGQEFHPLTEYTDYAQPIELTPEWAKRLGFEIVSGGISYDKDRLSLYFGDTILSEKKGRTYFNSWAILEHTPKHVHELQNLYYALTGDELSAL